MRRPRAILFDLDGTLVDSRLDIAAALNVALASVGLEPLTLGEVLPLVGDGARALCERALAKRGREPDERALAAFQEAYLAAPCARTTLLPGASAALALHLPRALVTNKPRAVTVLVLEHLEVRGSFGAVWAGGDGPLKPAPDGVLHAAKALGAPVDETWMVGDGPQDVLAGRAAGAFTVGVHGGIAEAARLEASRPDLLVGSLEELVEVVRRL